ncbi:MAG: FKBP-type peptidyl-prolyl cis-trans isomerase [Cryomorphaceae bacterium]
MSFTDNEQSLDSAQHYYVEYLISPLHRSDTLAYAFDQLVEPGDDPLRAFLQTRSVGDRLELVSSFRDTLNADLPYGDTLVYQLRIDRMRTKRQLEDSRLQELSTLDSLMRIDSVAAAYREMNGAYFQTITAGDTASVRRGKEIVIHYQGRTLDGKVFDDSRRMAAPLRFVYGNEDQVLEGLEIALSQMHLHEKAEVIIPSWLAFGSTGSADGRVLPYTSVIYEIEVFEVARDQLPQIAD